MRHPQVHIGIPKDYPNGYRKGDLIAIYGTNGTIKNSKIFLCDKEATPLEVVDSIGHEYLHHVLFHFINQTACIKLDTLTNHGEIDL